MTKFIHQKTAIYNACQTKKYKKTYKTRLTPWTVSYCKQDNVSYTVRVIRSLI